MKTKVSSVCSNPECNNTYEYTYRDHGGGKHKSYCCSKCCQRAWYLRTYKKQTPEEKARRIYPKRPEEELKQNKKRYARNKKLKQYGINREIFNRWLVEQNKKCLGCFSLIDEFSARIDHNHITGKARGLLCDHCNWVLGHAKDNTLVLENLIDYLRTRDG